MDEQMNEWMRRQLLQPIREEKTREEARRVLRKEAISPSLRVAEMGRLRLLCRPHNCAVLRAPRVGISGKKKILPSAVSRSEAAQPEDDQGGGEEENGSSTQ